MGHLKGKSSLIIFQKFGNMKFAYRNREFLCRGYYVDTVGKNTSKINWKQIDKLTGVKKAHMCAASSIRVIPKNEKQPAKLVDDYYCYNVNQ